MVTALTRKRQDSGTNSDSLRTVLSHLKHNQVKKFLEKEQLFISHLSSMHLEYKSQSCCLNPTFSLSLVSPSHAGSHLSLATQSALGVMATPTPSLSATSHNCLQIEGSSPVSRKHTLILFVQRQKGKGMRNTSEGDCMGHSTAGIAEREAKEQGRAGREERASARLAQPLLSELSAHTFPVSQENAAPQVRLSECPGCRHPQSPHTTQETSRLAGIFQSFLQ